MPVEFSYEVFPDSRMAFPSVYEDDRNICWFRTGTFFLWIHALEMLVSLIVVQMRNRYLFPNINEKSFSDVDFSERWTVHMS